MLSWKINITYSESASVTVVIQYAMLLRRIIFCGLSETTVLFFFSLYFIKGEIFWENVIEAKTCVLICSGLLLKYFLS